MSLDAIRRTTAHLPRIGGGGGSGGNGGELEDWSASLDVSKVRCTKLGGYCSSPFCYMHTYSSILK